MTAHRYPIAPYKTYEDYAHLLAKGHKLYPLERRNSDLAVKDTGECYLCAHGMLAAGLNPENMVQQIEYYKQKMIEQKTLEILHDASTFWRFNSFIALDDWTHQQHPLLKEWVLCPHKGEEDITLERTVDDMIVHLYDDHEWTIEQIEMWLLSLDEKREKGESLLT